MKNKIVSLYNILPKKLIHRIGKAKSLKFLRDAILRKKGIYKEAEVEINRSYLNYWVRFIFFASIKTAAKAYKGGIENTILRNSITLINRNNQVNDDCTVIDIGSNFGYLSLVWSNSICKNNGLVLSFESNSNVFKTFNKSIEANDLKNIIINENFAIGSENKKIQLFINNTTSNTQKTNISKESVEIEMRTIDSYLESKLINRCDLIKIDVDGLEFEILNGCIDTIIKFKPIFIVEANNDNRIINFFITRNYKILNMNLDEYSTNTEMPSNIFCIPN
ncbi:FkbM family methyltransferase [Lutibacter sp.]|uniref:FkbM family methyltransferase n=1 Tax=Lutibacter sp. TaxID=1925666 RepID=UPI0027367062|nr:FkbM family methyltransferase [Lutibacter sp.]MDP3312593.1 FkbM family methyltransferase [Lutibacter sp.]